MKIRYCLRKKAAENSKKERAGKEQERKGGKGEDARATC
jgi:hypothetical protein